MIFNKVIRKMDLDKDNITFIEYDVISIIDDTIKLQKIRRFNNTFSYEISPHDENEFDIFLEYPLLYVINNFQSKDNWHIFKTDVEK